MSLRRQLVGRKQKNSNFLYYLKNILSYLIPDFIFRLRLDSELEKISHFDREYTQNRVNYYHKEVEQKIEKTLVYLKDFRLKDKKRFLPLTHFFDLYRFVRYFPLQNAMSLLFGDNTIIPEHPSIVKSRPISSQNQNCILMKLNELRHFVFIKDKMSFEDKVNKLMSRCTIYQTHRVKFWEMYFGHPLCNLGQVNKKPRYNADWIVPYTSISEQLTYKFILCLEGNDVASSLKWVMSSNSIAVMPKPKYETWFMEGTLLPDVHYIEIKSDFSDLVERLEYFIKHTEKAKKIVENANRHVEQFKNEKREKLISLLVMKKYFDMMSKPADK
jgi:hypothetical protein